MRDFASIRSDFATQIGTLSGWTLAGVPADAFGVSDVGSAVASTQAHLSYAVGIGPSVPSSRVVSDRQRAAEGLLLDTEVSVRFLSRIAAKAKLDAVDAGLTAERNLLGKVLARSASWPLYFHVWFVSANRQTVPGSDWRQHDVRFLVLHRIAIT